MALMPGEEEKEEVSILEKILKILIVVVALAILYSYAAPVFDEIANNAQRDRVTRDFTIIGDALSRFQLTTGKPYVDTSLAGLVDKKLLQDLPKDPWGSEYVYNWFFDVLASPGPNRELDTFVPGLRDAASESENDDKAKSVTPVTHLVYFVNDASGGHIYRSDIDGVGAQAIDDSPNEVQGLSVLPLSKLIVYSVKRNSTVDLRLFDYSTGERSDLTNDPGRDVNPVWVSPKSDQLVFQSDRDTQGASQSLYLMTLPAKNVLRLTDKPLEEPGPGVDCHERRIVYYATRQGDRHSILAITLPDTTPVEIVSKPGPLSRPSPSPDGVHLAYFSQTPQGTTLEVIEVKSKKEVFRREGASPKGWIAWSPDAQKFLYQVEERGSAKLVLVHPLSKRAAAHPQFVMALGRFAWIK